MNETAQEFSNIRKLVIALLAGNERCRNDDKFLTFRVFEEIAKAHGRSVFIPFELWAEFPAFETVKRTRAQLQNVEGLYPPTDPQVVLKRQRREREVKQWLTKS